MDSSESIIIHRSKSKSQPKHPPDFASLRLTATQFGEYKCDHPDVDRDPVQKPCFRYRVRVRGYGEEATGVIRGANAYKGEEDFFEIWCWAQDSTVS